MTIVYLRVNGVLITEPHGNKRFPQGRPWDHVPVFGDVIHEMPPGDVTPPDDAVRYTVVGRTWMITDDTSAYPNSPQGVILDIVRREG